MLKSPANNARPNAGCISKHLTPRSAFHLAAGPSYFESAIGFTEISLAHPLTVAPRAWYRCCPVLEFQKTCGQHSQIWRRRLNAENRTTNSSQLSGKACESRMTQTRPFSTTPSHRFFYADASSISLAQSGYAGCRLVQITHTLPRRAQTIRQTPLPFIRFEEPSSARRSHYPYFKTNNQPVTLTSF